MKEHDQDQNNIIIATYEKLGLNREDAVAILHLSRVAVNLRLSSAEIKQIKSIVGRYSKKIGNEIKKIFPKYFQKDSI